MPERALGGIPLGFGIVVEDTPSELPHTCTCTWCMITMIFDWSNTSMCVYIDRLLGSLTISNTAVHIHIKHTRRIDGYEVNSHLSEII